jgi:hypothetical protein
MTSTVGVKREASRWCICNKENCIIPGSVDRYFSKKNIISLNPLI